MQKMLKVFFIFMCFLSISERYKELNNFGVFCASKGLFEDALFYLKKAQRLNDSPFIAYNLSVIYEVLSIPFEELQKEAQKKIDKIKSKNIKTKEISFKKYKKGILDPSEIDSINIDIQVQNNEVSTYTFVFVKQQLLDRLCDVLDYKISDKAQRKLFVLLQKEEFDEFKDYNLQTLFDDKKKEFFFMKQEIFYSKLSLKFLVFIFENEKEIFKKDYTLRVLKKGKARIEKDELLLECVEEFLSKFTYDVLPSEVVVKRKMYLL